LKFFRWFCRSEYVEDIEGDLLERFDHRVETKGVQKARKLFIKDVVKLFKPGLIKKLEGNQKFNYISMFKHNLLVSIRGFKRYKSAFFINLIGLASGLACAMFIYLWVTDELSVDKFHPNDDSLYQVYTNFKTPDGLRTWKGVPGLLLEEIQDQIPEVNTTVATTDSREFTISAGETALKAQIKFASKDFFKVFNYPLLIGNPSTALSDISGVVITETLAINLFGETDVIGKTLKPEFRGKGRDFTITAVLKDLPKNSSDQFEMVLTWDFYHNDLIEFKNWGNFYGRIVVSLNKGASSDLVAEKADEIIDEKQGQDRVDLMLVPFSEQYLHGNFKNGVSIGGRIQYVELFAIVGAFILLIASINFINLSTAKASHKAKETGIKKSLGATRGSLIIQFLTESVLLSTISLVVGLTIVFLFLPQFNSITDKQLVFQFNQELAIASIIIIGTIGLLAGVYPALYLSKFEAIKVLKGKFLNTRGVLGRKSLVVLQFALSTVLIVSVMILNEQMDFVKNSNLGYDRDNLVYFEREGALLSNGDAFLEEVKNIPGVSNAPLSGFMVGGGNATGGVDWEGKDEASRIQFWEINSGEGMLNMMGMEMVTGRDFSSDFVTDSTAIIFNEAAIKAMGLEDPIGKTVTHYTGTKRIIGIVKDFNFASLHSQVELTLFRFEPEDTPFVMVKLEKGNEGNSLSKIEDVYETFNPGFPFKPVFVDQDYQALYASEERVNSLSKYFAVLAIIISCLGLFGLTAFMTERRIKEIGIRKVLGSSVWNIVYLLTSDFSKMVLISILVGLPVSYFIGLNWLENFAYSIKLQWWFFAVAGIVTLIVAWITVAAQTLHTARMNPTKSLRAE
jgi:ABC-type antimicrobial peptide transport system permease subunit